jgi:hypothetical protein
MSGQKKISQLPSLTAATNQTLIAVVFSGASGNTTYSMTTQDFIKSLPFGTVYQSLIPNVTDTYTLGDSAHTFSSIHVGAGTVFIGPNNALGIDDDGVLYSTNVFAAPTFQVGNVTDAQSVVTTSGYTFSVLNQELIARKNSGGTIYNITRQLVPTGGTIGNVLTKTGSTQYEYGWAASSGTSGTSGTSGSSGTGGTSGTSGTSPTGTTRYYGAFTSNVTQTNPVASVARAMSADTTEYSSGVTLSASTRFVIQNAGVYNIQFSAQLQQLNNNDSQISIWFRKNGVDIPRSNTELAIDKNQGGTSKLVAAWNFVESFTANQYFEIMWSSPDSSMEILWQNTQTGPTRPVTPSIIVTVTQV